MELGVAIAAFQSMHRSSAHEAVSYFTQCSTVLFIFYVEKYTGPTV